MSTSPPRAQMLTLARESRGLTQKQLADETGISQGYISKAENGLRFMADDKVAVIAHALNYSRELFYCDDEIQGVDALFHRKLKTTPVTKLRKTQADINVRRIQVRRLLKGVAIEAPNTFPRYDPDEVAGAAEVARLVRRAWRLPLGPIADLVQLLEAAGGVVVSMKFETPKVSAAAIWPREDARPMFFVNVDHNAERHRFSLAHELGHIVMHTVPAPELEDPADAFAAELLMPEREARPQLAGGRLTLARMIDIKQYWRVSLAMVAKRAKDLGTVTDRQARSIWQMLNARGYLKQEPYTVSHERAAVLRTAIDVHAREHDYSANDLAALAFIPVREFAESFDATHAGPRRLRAV